jgi:hypothetical protein
MLNVVDERAIVVVSRRWRYVSLRAETKHFSTSYLFGNEMFRLDESAKLCGSLDHNT